MSFLSFAQYHYFRRFLKGVRENRNHARECQQETLRRLIGTAKQTVFGKEHQFEKIQNYEDFKRLVPIRSYEEIHPYIQKIFEGNDSVLWPGRPAFFGKSSGTTGNPKLLPVTREFLKCTQNAARYMLCNLGEQCNQHIFGNRVLYLTDQQHFEDVKGFLCGAISAIKAYNMPSWAKRFALPGKEVDLINDPSKKINFTIDNIHGHNIRMAVALPVYLSHFLRQFELRSGSKFKDAFPDFSVLFLSGMNFEPYEDLLREYMGDDIIIMENYSATEGNFAYQVTPGKKGMELICNQGIFYEFIPLEEIDDREPSRLQLSEVQTSKPYSMIISANNGLWAYVLNDIVEFISTDPYRLVVCGRTKDIFSPFGEHMLPIHAEKAIAETCRLTANTLIDFVVIPDFKSSPYRYTCYAAFENEMADGFAFSSTLHSQLCRNNSYYNDLTLTGAIAIPELIILKRDFFQQLFADGTESSAQRKMKHLVSNEKMATRLREESA